MHAGSTARQTETASTAIPTLHVFPETDRFAHCRATGAGGVAHAFGASLNGMRATQCAGAGSGAKRKAAERRGQRGGNVGRGGGGGDGSDASDKENAGGAAVLADERPGRLDKLSRGGTGGGGGGGGTGGGGRGGGNALSNKDAGVDAFHGGKCPGEAGGREFAAAVAEDVAAQALLMLL